MSNTVAKKRRNITAVEEELFELIEKDVDNNGITTKERDVNGLKKLLKQRRSPRTFDIKCCNEDGFTPLMEVCDEIDHNFSMSISAAEERRSSEIITLLLDYGADVNIQNNVDRACLGMTALHYACCSSSSNIVKLLLQYGANPHLPDDDNTTPLFSSSSWADNEKMKALLECGADANFKDSSGSAPIHELLHIGYSEGTIQDVVCGFKLLLQYGANINVQNIAGATPLFLAIHNSPQGSDEELALIQLLIDANADVYIQLKDSIEYGQHYCNPAGDTPLHDAVRIGKIKVIKLLLLCHPNLSIRNSDDETAIDIAKRLQLIDIVEVIEEELRHQIYKYLLHEWTPINIPKCFPNQVVIVSTSPLILKRKFFQR